MIWSTPAICLLDTARKAANKVAGKTREEYDQDENLRMALAHLIQTLGEAARRVSSSCQQAHAGIPWKQIIGMRHKVVHDYLHVDFDIVWTVVTSDLPPLIAELEKFVPPAVA